MRSIFQCQECEGGPCYVCAPNQTCSGSPYDLGGALAPLVCPYSPHWERCEFEAMPSYTATNSPFDPLLEWLNTDEGYEKSSAPLRDAIFAQWFDADLEETEAVIASRNALLTMEDCRGATWTLDMDEIEKKFKKISKIRLAKMAWSRGFQAGLMAAEKIRVKLEAKAKDGWQPW